MKACAPSVVLPVKTCASSSVTSFFGMHEHDVCYFFFGIRDACICILGLVGTVGDSEEYLLLALCSALSTHLYMHVM
jgi:hypothetical protein